MVFKNDTHSSFDPVQKDSNKESILFDRLCKKMENKVDKSISDSNGRRFFLKTILASVGAIGASFASGYVDGQVCFPESQSPDCIDDQICQPGSGDLIDDCPTNGLVCYPEGVVPPCTELALTCPSMVCTNFDEVCDNWLFPCDPLDIA